MEGGGEEIAPMFMSFGRFEIIPRTPAGKLSMISPESGKTPAAPDSARAPPVMNPTPSSAIRAVPVSSQMNSMAPQSFLSAACLPAHHPSLSKMDFSMKVSLLQLSLLNKIKITSFFSSECIIHAWTAKPPTSRYGSTACNDELPSSSIKRNATTSISKLCHGTSP